MHSTKPHHEAVHADWASRGYSCELWIDPSDQVWQDFEHDVDELIVLLEGNCQIELKGRTLQLNIGEELVIPAGTKYTARGYGEGPTRWLHGYPRSNQSIPAAPSRQLNATSEQVGELRA